MAPSNCPGPCIARPRSGTPQPTLAFGASVTEPSSCVAVVSNTCKACSLFKYG